LECSLPIRDSIVSGVVIFAGTSGEYSGAAAGVPVGGCEMPGPALAVSQ
jgi:hypothetical protein